MDLLRLALLLASPPTRKPTTVTTAPVAKGSHCVAADDRGGAWICDPQGGRLLYFKDVP
jgi:hypothetical protein